MVRDKRNTTGKKTSMLAIMAIKEVPMLVLKYKNDTRKAKIPSPTLRP